jgi:hypothetical protein
MDDFSQVLISLPSASSKPRCVGAVCSPHVCRQPNVARDWLSTPIPGFSHHLSSVQPTSRRVDAVSSLRVARRAPTVARDRRFECQSLAFPPPLSPLPPSLPARLAARRVRTLCSPRVDPWLPSPAPPSLSLPPPPPPA